MNATPDIRRALIFAGAGASFAVDKNAYPTTIQFFDRLPDKIKKHKLIEAILQKLPQKFGDGQPDVEKILWSLQELHDYLSLLKDPKHPASWFMPNNQLSGLVGSDAPTQHFVSVANAARATISELLSEISSKVYDFYSTVPTQENCQNNWQLLFDFIASKKLWPDIVTTNYDLVIESASKYAGQPINFGKTSDVVSALDYDLWKKSLSDPSFIPPGDGLLTKLHGSVNWLRERKGIIFGGTEYKGNHAHHGVVYPGFKGIPKDEPFSLLHSYFETAIQRADLIIFIGFAFRDEYINTCLERNLGKKQIFVIDPSEIKVPVELRDRTVHIKSGFDSNAIKMLKSMTAGYVLSLNVQAKVEAQKARKSYQVDK